MEKTFHFFLNDPADPRHYCDLLEISKVHWYVSAIDKRPNLKDNPWELASEPVLGYPIELSELKARIRVRFYYPKQLLC